MRRVIQCLSMCCLMAWGQLAWAQAEPVKILSGVTEVILHKLKTNSVLYKAKHEVLVDMVDKEMMPYVATELLAQNVVGRHHWQEASVAQRKDFMGLFVEMVVQVYASALTSYTDQTIKFLPLRNFKPTQSVVNVRSLVMPSGTQQHILITYQMIKVGGKWKVLDFSVDGVSLTNNYHSQFSNDLANHGMASLLEKMRQKVRKK